MSNIHFDPFLPSDTILHPEDSPSNWDEHSLSKSNDSCPTNPLDLAIADSLSTNIDSQPSDSQSFQPRANFRDRADSNDERQSEDSHFYIDPDIISPSGKDIPQQLP